MRTFLVMLRDDAGDDRARRPEIVDAGMVLVGDDVEAEIVAQPVLVEDLVVQPRGDLRVAVAVGQAGAHRVGLLQHLVRHERVRVLAVVPQLHEPTSFSPLAGGHPMQRGTVHTVKNIFYSRCGKKLPARFVVD